MVQRTSVRGISRYGRASQGVRVMNIRDDDQVSAVALVVESEASTAAPVVGDENGSVAAEEPGVVDVSAVVDESAGADDEFVADDESVGGDESVADDDAEAGDDPATDDE